MTARKPRNARRRRADASSTAAPKEGVWERLTERSQHAICIAVLCIASIGFFAPVHFSGLSLVGGDTVEWRAMAEYVLAYRAETGEEPLWAPNAFAGMPAYFISPKTLVPQIDNVLQFLRSFLWPSSHLILLLLGTYFLVVYLTRNKLAGLLAAVGFGLTTYLPIILVAGHNSKFIALASAPWLVLAFAHALRRPGLLAGLLFAIVLAMNLRAGHIQPTYYISFLLGIWWIVEAVSAFRRGEAMHVVRVTVWLAVGALLGLLMVAQPYLSQLESKAYTVRGAASGGEAGGLDWAYAMNWSQGAGELVTLLVADAYGGAAAYWGPKPGTGGPHYVGGILLMLAGLAVWRLRNRTVTAFAIGVLIMILFSLGEHFALLNRPMYLHFPLFNALRAPETWLSAAAFAISVLAAYGAWHVTRIREDDPARTDAGREVYLASGASVVFVLFLLLFGSTIFSFERPDEHLLIEQQLLMQQPELSANDPQVQSFIRRHVSEQVELRKEMYTSDAMRTLVFLVLAGVLLVLYTRGRLSGPPLLAALSLLVLIDLWGVGRRYLNEDRLTPRRDPEAQIPRYAFDEFILERQREAGGMGRFRVVSFEGAHPTQNARPSYYFESLGGYHGAKLRVYQDFLDHLLIAGGRPNDNALDMMNTRFVVAPMQLGGLSPVYRDDQTGMIVMENEDALPRALLVGEVEVIPTAEATWERILDPQFDPRRAVLLRQEPDFPVTPIDATSAVDVALERYTPRHITWNVTSDAPRVLLVSEVYYPAGWTATVNGSEVPILPANYLLRAVPVPAGTHRVEMTFSPASHTIGVWVSAVSTILVYGGTLLLLGLSVYRRRRLKSGAGVSTASAK